MTAVLSLDHCISWLFCCGVDGVIVQLPGVKLAPLIEAIRKSRPAREHILARMHEGVPEVAVAAPALCPCL